MLLEKEPSLIQMTDKNGETVLHAVNNRKCCKILIRKLPQLINSVNNYGWSPLHNAVVGHLSPVVEILLPLTNHKNINSLQTINFKWLNDSTERSDQISLLHLATNVTQNEYSAQDLIFQMIIKTYPDMIHMVSKQHGFTVLHLFVLLRIGKQDRVKWNYRSMLLLLDHFSYVVNEVDEKGCTGLHYIVKYPSSELRVIELLLSRMNVDAICAVNTEGKTALDIATESDFPKAVEIIQKNVLLLKNII